MSLSRELGDTQPRKAFRDSWLLPFSLFSVLAALWFFVALSFGYTIEGDNAHIAIRAFDAAHLRPPLLGMPSTAGNEVAGVEAFHPGPIQFILLAPIFALSGWSAWGLMLAALTLNLALVAISLKVAWNFGSAFVKNAVVSVFLLLMIVMQFFMYSPWNPFPAVLGAVTLSVIIWAILVGEHGLWPLFVFVASVVAQVHLVGAAIVFVLVVFLFALGAKVRRFASVPIGELLLSLIIFVFCWALPLWDLVASDPSNATQILNYLRGVSEVSAARPTHLEPREVLTIGLVLLLVSSTTLFGLRRSVIEFRKIRIERPLNDRAVLAVGLALTTLTMSAAILIGVLVGAPRLPYLLLFLGVWCLQLCLLRPRELAYWQTWATKSRWIATAFLVSTFAMAATGLAYPKRAAQNAPAVAAARTLVESRDISELTVEQSGIQVVGSTGMAIVADLIFSGRDVYYEHFGNRRDYDNWRRPDSKMTTRYFMHIMERNSDGNWPDLPSGRLVSSVELKLADTGTLIRLVLVDTGSAANH